MGKKSKRPSRKNNNNKSQTASLDNNEPVLRMPYIPPDAKRRSEMLVRKALEACPLNRLHSLFKELAYASREGLSLETPAVTVTEADLEKDPDKARETMIANIPWIPMGPFCHPSYQLAALKDIRKNGGVKLTSVNGQSKVGSFAYTCGFTLIGGKELLLRDIHRSMLNDQIANTLNWFYERHKDGHPLGNGHTVELGNIAFIVSAPDPVEATLLKWSKTLEPTRLFGISGYDILELIPVAVKRGGLKDDDSERLSRVDVLAIQKLGVSIKGFKPLQGKVKKMQACSYCHETHDTSVNGTKLFKCAGCEEVYYCNRACQLVHWKTHKAACRARYKGTDKAVGKLKKALLEPNFEKRYDIMHAKN